MRRGGARRRYVHPGATPVWCAGRWGRKRVRVTQCWAALTAEALYTRLMGDDLTAPSYRCSGAYSLAHWLTLSARKDRAAASEERYAERRAILKRASGA